MTITDVLDRAGTDDLKHLAAIGITALGALKGSHDDDFDGGDFIERINQVIHDVAPEVAPRPAFLPTDEQSRDTDGQAWRDTLDDFLWDLS